VNCQKDIFFIVNQLIMAKQIIFALILLVTLGIFAFTIQRLISFFKFTKANFPIRDFGKRFIVMLDVAIGQTKIFRRPVIGFFHALVFWGFCVILFGSIEMIIDGLFGVEKSLKVFGMLHNFIMASGDVFALLVAISIVIFIIRRLFLHISRFEGIEMKKVSHQDANIALSMILLLMLSLLGMNAAYLQLQEATGEPVYGIYPVARLLAPIFGGFSTNELSITFEICWWAHILLIFIFANILPYSKHFHVFMSVPNTFLSRLEPLGKLTNMDDITREVKLMLDPNATFETPAVDAPISRFGVKDVEDVSWKNYFDSLSCTECGRCTSVCPANTTGKMLSPRKIFMNLRARMKEKGPGLVKEGREFSDNKSFLYDYVSEEELWACTTCNACAQECPVNINHPTLIVDMRRYLVMEESKAPTGLKTMFSNIENNGAPWQYSSEDRLLWAENLEIKVL
jgi:heterodisulfide reductase subunit C/nitrate reductase gamma subunit